jgi:hypothetical protein
MAARAVPGTAPKAARDAPACKSCLRVVVSMVVLLFKICATKDGWHAQSGKYRDRRRLRQCADVSARTAVMKHVERAICIAFKTQISLQRNKIMREKLLNSE